MCKVIYLPAWLSVLSLMVALFVPLGLTLIVDTSMDMGDKVRNIVHNGAGRFIPPDASEKKAIARN